MALVEVVCFGLVMLTDGKLGKGFYLIKENGERDSLELIYSKKAFPHAEAGNVYQIDRNEETKQIMLNSIRYLRRWPNADEVIAWDRNSESVKVQERRKNLEKKGGEQNDFLFERDLRNIKAAYWKTDRIGRRLMEFDIIEFLRRP